jgi:peptide/nickel transport system ATP-binding protein
MPTGFVLRGLSIRDATGSIVVRGVNLRADAGQALIVIGETGSGKSLIAQAMLGLLPTGFHATGTMQLAGVSPTDLSRRGAVRRHWSCGTMILPQEPRAALDPTMRISAQLAEATAEDRSDTMLAAVGLAPEVRQAYPFALSGGMAQRVLVAIALGSTAPVVVVDEPTKGLDPERIDQVIALLRTLLSEGRSLVVITHDVALARGLGGTVAVLRDGRIVECRPADDLFASPDHDYTREWLAADPARWPTKAAPARQEVVLAAQGVGFGYPGHRTLFTNIDLSVARGALLALVGPSGCGKTTLGNILVGLQRPNTGRVIWCGNDPYADRPALRRMRRRYQKLHQDPVTAFLPHRLLRRQFADLTELLPDLDLDTKLGGILGKLGLRDGLLDRYPAEVSGGEAQRLALARLLLLDPLLIVADEPTSRLDPILQRETIELLLHVLREQGVGLVLISHNQAMTEALTGDLVHLGRNGTMSRAFEEGVAA